jgi:hypothetical protein
MSHCKALTIKQAKMEKSLLDKGINGILSKSVIENDHKHGQLHSSYAIEFRTLP